MEKYPVSLVIITMNEEAHLGRCIKSVPWAGEIVIVDSGSTDRTTTIANDLGAIVYHEAWRGFGPQKRRAVELAKHDWVLCLDADEALSPELANEIKMILQNQIFNRDAYAMPRKTFHLGRWIMHGGWYPDFQVRLFRKSMCQWSPDELHEYVESERAQRLKYPLEHMAFDNLYDQVRTNNRYSSISAKTMYKRKSRLRISRLIFRPFIKFIECYFIKSGFRDGTPGFIIAIGAAYSAFLKYAKLWEHHMEAERAIAKSAGAKAPIAVSAEEPYKRRDTFRRL